MTQDYVELAIGQFGWWQAKCSLFMALLRMPTAWFQLEILFLAPETRFACRDNEHLLDVTNELTNSTCLAKDGSLCSEWIYDRTIFSETIITQWGLICDKEYLITVTQTSFMFGVLIGNVIFGVLADKYGRKIPLMVTIFVQALTGMASSYVPSFWLFLLLRFLLALATGGTMIISFVLCMETLSGKWRTIISILYQVPFGLGHALMATVSYNYRDWRDFNTVLSLLSSLFLFYWWLIPESPRWLLAVGQHQEAVKLLRSAAITNNRSEEQIKALLSLNTANKYKGNVPPRKDNATDLFTNPSLRKISIFVFVSWFIAGLCFFALNQYQGKLGGDLFVNVILSGLLGGIPGPIASVYVVQKFGRRYTIVLSLTAAGIACLSIAAVPIGLFSQDWPRRALSTISLMGMSVSYPTLYLFSGELFPTVLRNVGVGTAAMCARSGSMLASFLLLTSTWGSWVPIVMLGLFTLISALCVFPLPETKDRPLLDTIEEFENYNRECKSKLPCYNKEYKAVPFTENT